MTTISTDFSRTSRDSHSSGSLCGVKWRSRRRRIYLQISAVIKVLKVKQISLDAVCGLPMQFGTQRRSTSDSLILTFGESTMLRLIRTFGPLENCWFTYAFCFGRFAPTFPLLCSGRFATKKLVLCVHG
ncbi:hypothetical protein NMG60_11012416 [Bertholletia excelsa]